MLDRSLEVGGILLVSGTPRPSPRVPPTLLSVCLASAVPLGLRMHVVLAVLRGFFFFFSLLMARQIHPCPSGPANKSAAIGGSIIPGQGFLLGIAPAGWQNACGGPRVSIPGPAGLAFPLLWCLGHSSALGGAWKGLKGLQSSGTDRHMEGAPRCSYGMGTPSTNGHNQDGLLGGQAHGSRNNNKPQNHHITQSQAC